jgi:hypothetical protein
MEKTEVKIRGKYNFYDFNFHIHNFRIFSSVFSPHSFQSFVVCILLTSLRYELKGVPQAMVGAVNFRKYSCVAINSKGKKLIAWWEVKGFINNLVVMSFGRLMIIKVTRQQIEGVWPLKELRRLWQLMWVLRFFINKCFSGSI